MNLVLFIWLQFSSSDCYNFSLQIKERLEGSFCGPPSVVRESFNHSHQTFHQVSTDTLSLSKQRSNVNVIVDHWYWCLNSFLAARSLAGRCASSTACRNWLSLFLWTSCKSQNASESEYTLSITTARAVIVRPPGV